LSLEREGEMMGILSLNQEGKDARIGRIGDCLGVRKEGKFVLNQERKDAKIGRIGYWEV